MILTDYYKGQKLTEAKSRFDIVTSTGEYDLFERLLINKRGFNINGLSFYCGERPDRWKPKNASLAITKGNHNITSVTRPNVKKNYAYGDINGTNDGCIIIFNSDFRESGINTIEIFIARGLQNDLNGLWDLLIDNELKEEMDKLKQKAVTIIVTNL